MFIKALRIKIATAAFCIAIAGLTGMNAAHATQPQANLLKVGDKININVEGEKDLSGSYTINKAGMVDVPLIGNILLAGKTTHEAKALIAKKLKDGYLLKPDVLVKGNPLAEKPEEKAKEKHHDAPKEIAASHKKPMKHMRQHKKTSDYKNYGSNEKKCSKKKIYIVGAVKNPGHYVIPKSAGHILNIIALAGGYTDKADTSSFELVRNIDGTYYRKQADTGALNYQNGDIVIIEER